jgi:hypothetical protein
MSKFEPPKRRLFETNIGNERIDVIGGMKEEESLIYVTGGKCTMPEVLNHQLHDIAHKHIVFDDKYHGHQNSFRRDISAIE